MCKIYVLKHDTPEIKMGAELTFNSERGRYEVSNLSEVARYPLTPRSHFSFHKDVVESKSYWFELVDFGIDCECDCHQS